MTFNMTSVVEFKYGSNLMPAGTNFVATTRRDARALRLIERANFADTTSLNEAFGPIEISYRRLGDPIPTDGSTPPTPVDPEAGLTVTTTVAEGAVIDLSAAKRGQPLVLSMDLTGVETTEGYLIELGGAWGVVVYFKNGTFNVMFTDGTSQTAVLQAPGALMSGDYKLTIQIVPNSAIAAWKGTDRLVGGQDGVSISGTVAGAWASTDDGAYLAGFGGAMTPNPNIINQAATYATASGLRYYEGQKVAGT